MTGWRFLPAGREVRGWPSVEAADDLRWHGDVYIEVPAADEPTAVRVIPPAETGPRFWCRRPTEEDPDDRRP